MPHILHKKQITQHSSYTCHVQDLIRQLCVESESSGPTPGHRPKVVNNHGFLMILAHCFTWVPEGNLAGVFWVHVRGLAGPKGPGKPSKMWGASPPTDFKAFPGPPGPARPQKRTQKIRPDCLQVPSFLMILAQSVKQEVRFRWVLALRRIRESQGDAKSEGMAPDEAPGVLLCWARWLL